MHPGMYYLTPRVVVVELSLSSYLKVSHSYNTGWPKRPRTWQTGVGCFPRFDCPLSRRAFLYGLTVHD